MRKAKRNTVLRRANCFFNCNILFFKAVYRRVFFDARGEKRVVLRWAARFLTHAFYPRSDSAANILNSRDIFVVVDVLHGVVCTEKVCRYAIAPRWTIPCSNHKNHNYSEISANMHYIVIACATCCKFSSLYHLFDLHWQLNCTCVFVTVKLLALRCLRLTFHIFSIAALHIFAREAR